MNKEELVDLLLTKTIRFTGDGHSVVISQFPDGEPVIRVDGEIVDSSVLYSFSEFYVPSCMNTPYGVVRFSLGGLYVF